MERGDSLQGAVGNKRSGRKQGEQQETREEINKAGSEQVSEIRLVERDYKIMQEIDRWRVCQGRHIKTLVGFDGQRACDRRLRKLIEAGYIKREKILYGVAGIYRNENKAKQVVQLSGVNQKIRIEHIKHDIIVIDTAIYFNEKFGVKYNTIITEIELHRRDGFGKRRHRPDFVYTEDGKKISCVEIELTLKSKDRFETNIKNNFLEYEKQTWVVPSMETKIADMLKDNMTKYTNIEILELEEIQKNV